jgi:hypothetical protein
MKTISFLLGAGFSAPMGYPIGNTLNSQLLGCKETDFWFHSDGRLIPGDRNIVANPYFNSSDDVVFDFCRDLIHYFNVKNKYFDYEEFYDFMLGEAHHDSHVAQLASKYSSRFSDKDQLLFRMKSVFTQLVGYHIKDKHGKKWYDDEPFLSGYIFPGYSGILNYIKFLGTKYDVVNIHSLNHDMFFEMFKSSEWMSGELVDGFEELGSTYYGKLDVKDREYMCRLSYYTGKYDGKFRFYKLHGSLDYGVYYGFQGPTAIPEVYIKTRYGIGPQELYREREDDNGVRYYEFCPVNYHADFLTGTTSKIERYAEPLLFQKLFELFRENLKQSEELIIIGYGGKDSEVNKMLYENFDYKNRQTFIIDPYAGAKVMELKESLGAKLISTQLEYITQKDFEA